MSDVCFIPYPYSGNMETGKALDKVARHLIHNFQYKSVVSVGEKKGSLLPNLHKLLHNEIKLFRMLKGINSRIYHAFHPLAAKTALALRKKPLITSIHDIVPLFLNNHPYLRIFWKKAAKQSDILITSSQHTRTTIKQKYGVDSHVVYCPVDTKRFYPMNLPKKYDVLYLGPRHHLRGYYEVRKACKRLPSLKCFLADYFIPETQLPRIINQAKIFVHPSKVGFSLSQFEAMACGVPVIAGPSFDAKDCLGNNVLYASSWKEIKKAIFTLRREDVRNEFIKKGLAHVQKFTVESMVEQVKKVYASLD